MNNPDSLLAAAEQIASLLAGGGVDAVVIGAAALAAHQYVRSTEDIDLGVNVAIRDFRHLAERLRDAGYDVAFREPDGDDPLGGVMDVSGPFGLVQVVNFGERFPTVIDRCHAEPKLCVRAGVRSFFDLAFAKRPAEEFYDLRRDPGQGVNRAADPGYAEVKATLSRRLDERLVATGDPRAAGRGDAFDAYPYLGPIGAAKGEKR